MDYLLLISSVLAGSGRSVCIKGCNKSIENPTQLFFCTFLSSLIAGILIALSGTSSLVVPDMRTVVIAIVFAFANIMADVFNMQAIKNGSYALSSVFLSSNFIIPSLSGVLFWHETVSIWQIIGLILIICALIAVTVDKKDVSSATNKKWLFFAVGSLLFGGLIGLTQKVYCSVENVNLTLMLVIAFAIKTIFAFICFAFCSKKQYKRLCFEPKNRSFLLWTLVMSISMAYIMKVNLYLSGALQSIIVFPCLNGGEILVTTILSVCIYKEKLTQKKLVGIIAVIVGIIFVGDVMSFII